MKLKIVQSILRDNDSISRELGSLFNSRGLYVFNVISSPGAGKTTFLESLLSIITRHWKTGVIVGDIEDSVDGQRLSRTGVQVVQLNTKGACHLDAGMIREALREINLEGLDLLIIENVGNLVCPSDFSLGEDDRVVLLSVTEGDDKPRKYPATFAKASAVVINKTDLLPHTNFNMEKAEIDIRRLNPAVRLYQTTATKPETLHEFVRFIEDRMRWKKQQKPAG